MTDTNLPPTSDGLAEISERLQEYNQTLQEQAFLLGYRNGYREGGMMQDLLEFVREQSRQPDIPEAERTAWKCVEEHLAANGAYIPEDAEITHPPGLNCYIGAADSRPHLQVAGERIHIEDFGFEWKPNEHADSVDDFEPHQEVATIELSFQMELPRDSEEREELLEYLEGLR